MTFTTWRIGFPFLLYPKRQRFSLWSLCKYSAVILAWKPPRCNHFDLGTSSFTRLPSFPGIASALQHIPTQRYQIQDVWRASSKQNEACGSFTFFRFTGSLLAKFKRLDSLSFNKFQSFNICLASSFLYASTEQESTHVPLLSCLVHQSHMRGNHSSCYETVESRRGEKPGKFETLKDEKCGSRVLFSSQKISLDLICWNIPNHDV